MKIRAAKINIDIAYIFVVVYADQNNFRMYLILFFLPKITTRVYFHQWLDLLIQVPEEVRKGLMILKSVNLNHRKLSEKVNFRIFFLLVFGSCCERDDEPRYLLT